MRQNRLIGSPMRMEILPTIDLDLPPPADRTSIPQANYQRFHQWNLRMRVYLEAEAAARARAVIDQEAQAAHGDTSLPLEQLEHFFLMRAAAARQQRHLGGLAIQARIRNLPSRFTKEPTT